LIVADLNFLPPFPLGQTIIPPSNTNGVSE
jgi:hypothetical protein